ncbi:neutral zinc metallopeptidase [Neisseria sp. Dent CA1/247]|uniref:KPN_02809 family neutral zinc metallopeptidase n=1 Tax=Neisseria sp. Dent CA1/247 TaxID=2912675 RepID=UPI001FD105D5|nr:neutral zinc metallopeptidase [Neisseria sp. Dent CA1/247]UOO76319.1 neutral zinc metallopeptidase [Neisseria sp. Dent CA1/247]
MRWQGRKQSSNVEDRRGRSGRIGGKGTGIIGIIILLVGAYYGVDLSGLVGTPSPTQITQPQTKLDSKLEAQLNELSRVVLADTETVWSNYFAKNGSRYTPTTLVLYTAGTQTACGTGQAAMGPFYCPADRKVYIDLSFYEDMRKKLGASGDAAFSYVIAHEVGHHIQNLLGILPQVNQMQQAANSKAQANALSVKLELQADCFAGIWAHYAVNQNLFEEGDIEEAVNAAEAVGDDRLQQQSKGYVVHDSFTHGSSAQRMAWFKRGLNSGDVNQCNTFGN